MPPETRELLPGQIRDINGISISAAVQAMGGEVIYDGIVTDDFDEYLRRSKELFEQVDFLILSGGVRWGGRTILAE